MDFVIFVIVIIRNNQGYIYCVQIAPLVSVALTHLGRNSMDDILNAFRQGDCSFLY